MSLSFFSAFGYCVHCQHFTLSAISFLLGAFFLVSETPNPTHMEVTIERDK